MTGRRSAAVTVILGAALLCAIAVLFWQSVKGHYNREKIIFSMEDPRGDDYGPGSYQYPFGAIFDPQKEHFDLRKFSFISHRHNYYFDMLFPRVTNPWGASEGFSHTMIQIYISTDPDSGRIEPFKEGANVLFDPRNPWKYLIKVVSFNRSAVYWDTDFAEAEGRTAGVKAGLLADGKTVRVTVPKDLLPGDPLKWKFYVLVGSQDGNGPDNYRPVKAVAGQWHFGGGTDTDYSPNVIDLLAPPGRQEKMLSAYSVAERSRAVIEPVGPTPVKLTRWGKIMNKAEELLIRMKFRL